MESLVLAHVFSSWLLMLVRLLWKQKLGIFWIYNMLTQFTESKLIWLEMSINSALSNMGTKIWVLLRVRHHMFSGPISYAKILAVACFTLPPPPALLFSECWIALYICILSKFQPVNFDFKFQFIECWVSMLFKICCFFTLAFVLSF